MPLPRSRTVAIAAIAAVVAATCVALGLWQLRRLDERRMSNARIVRAGAEPAVVITSASGADAAHAYRRVHAAGTYDTSHEVIVYGRSLGGAPGHHVVTPLVLDDGSAVLVLRGWVPFGLQEPPIGRANPPTTGVAIEGTLVPDEGDGQMMPDARGVIRRLDVRGIAAMLPYEVFPLAIQLERQTPPQEGLPRPIPDPELSEGPHLSYA
ncbi:MAG: SURF1 family protein, partial [Gemmatimonadota bacterium]